MSQPKAQPETDSLKRLKGLMLFRVLFAFILLGSTLIYRIGEDSPSPAEPHLILFGISIGILFLSIVYFIVLKIVSDAVYFLYFQLIIDSFVITLIIFLTGSYVSVFNFMYLIVIIYSSMLLFRRGSLAVATCCSMQYGFMIALEYKSIFIPYGMESGILSGNVGLFPVVYKVLATVVACYAIAFLGSLLAEQEKKTKKELLALEDHVKRVEKTAAMGEMAAGLAHEVKNPLASLSGSIQLLREELSYNPDHEKLMQIILREADRLSTLVNDFLLFARPKIGEKKRFEIHGVLAETVELFEKDATNKDRVKIIKKFAANLWVEMDPGHMRQVLWNLLLNAREAIDENGTIIIRSYPLKQTHVCIEIKDDGCGISDDILGSIFNPFFTTRQNGTGLGLSIVQRILAYYNCLLDVKSKIGEGTVFILKLEQVAHQRQ